MKKLLAISLMLGCSAGLFAAETAVPAKPAPAPAAVDPSNVPQPSDRWTMFQLVFLPNVPNSTWNTNTNGLKTGWPASGGIGTVIFTVGGLVLILAAAVIYVAKRRLDRD